MLFLTLVFVLSGAAGLIYESIWSRYLGLFVGHSAYAQIIVLVIFLGGMSAGAYLVGQRSERVQRPFRAYAYIELAAGVTGVLFDDVYRMVTGVAYDHIFPALAGGPGLTIAKWGLAGLLILPQSILLGATFPLMSAGALRLRGDRPGQTLGLLYFANSLGAAIGVLLAGFALIRWVGLPGTLITAAAINVGVGLAVIFAEQSFGWDELEPGGGRRVEGGASVNEEQLGIEGLDDSTRRPPPSALGPLWRLLLAVSFGTAIASFIYEIAWIRMLSLVLGSATHSFELMLSAFILGLAIGAYWVRTRADRFADPIRALGVVQWIMGMAAIATLPLYIMSFEWMAAFQQALQRTPPAYSAFMLVRYAICLVVMLPATFCAGMTLPLITRTLIAAGAGERAVGAVYAINTLGSIVGVALAGLVLMPILGLKMLLIVGALVDIALGVVLLRPTLRRVRSERVPLVVGVAVASVAFVIGTAAFLRFEPAVLSSGVFRYGRVSRPEHYILHYYRDGRTATVSVRQPRDNDLISLVTNGKPDASVEASWLKPLPPNAPRVPLTRDLSAQFLLPLATLAHAPQARVGVVIGQGSGITSQLLLGSPHLRHLATIEIEPEMIEASRVFLAVNRRVFEDPRSTFVIDDAKSYFAAGGRRTYDLILSEPSNPWVSGVAGLFTVEFYQRVRRHLSEGGVFGQWVQLYEMDDNLVLSVLAAIDEVFADYEIFITGSADMLIVASMGRLPAPDWSVVDFPGIREDLRRVLPLSAVSLEQTRLASRSVVHPLVRLDARANSDFWPILDLGAERARFMAQPATGFRSLGERRFDLVAALTGRRFGFGADLLAAAPDIKRVAALSFAAQIRDLRAKAMTPRTDSAPVEGTIAAAVYRRDVLDRLAASGRPPSDWRVWVDQFVEAESDLHRGTAGVADEQFYGPMLRYARTQGAPLAAVAAIEFFHGLAAWNYGEVLAASPTLEAAQRARRQWISPELLREGTVVAHLATGDVTGARRRMQELSPIGQQGDDAFRFRSRLLFSYILFAEREKKETKE